MKKFDPEKVKLDAYEQEIEDAIGRGELRRAKNADALIKEAKQMAAAYMRNKRKDARITIRLSSSDLAAIKRRAAEEGLPYQTLISSVLHKYTTGRPIT